MRRTAQSIRGELEETRAELKKGAIDMPVEAKESTTAIRRAVSEQINALKELSDIVAKSGRMFDVSDRGSSRRGAGRADLRAGRARARAAAPACTAARGCGAARACGRPSLPRQRSTWSALPRPIRRVRGNGQSQQGGWVRDLLRGASRNEEELRFWPSSRRPVRPRRSARRCTSSNR